MISLVAKRPLTYAGRAFVAGDVFEAQPIDAAVLTYRRSAVFAQKGAELTPATEPEPPPTRRRRYRRRDMMAEP